MSNIEKNKQVKQFQAIEYLAYWEGGVNSAVLAKCIGTSNLTARKHIATYLENYPENLKYNPNSPDKLYVPDWDFKLHTVTDKWQDYLAFTSSINNLSALPIYSIFDNSCGASLQNVNSEVFRDIYKAIKRKEQVTIKYYSERRPEGLVKIIQPNALASDGLLWYCRAFCNQEECFKDFYIGRIKKVILSEPSIMHSQVDHDWENYISLTITANQNLSPTMQKMVLLNYGYSKPFKASIRKAMVHHFLKHQKISVDIECDEPNKKPLMLLNTNDEIDTPIDLI